MLEGIIPQNRVKEFTAQDGTQVIYREWEGKKQKGIIIYLHGLESHTGWFIETGNLLNRKGFHIYALDRRGSGMNQADRGHMESYKTLIDDVNDIIDLARGEHPGEKIYLMGLCWGGKIAVMFTAHHQDLINGLILIAPAIKTKVGFPLKQKIDVIFSNIIRPRKLFDVPLDDRMFTKNPKHIEFIKADKLKLKKATARFFFETGKLNFCLDRIAPKIQIPVLILLAEDDAIVNNKAVKTWFDRLGSKDKRLKVCQDCYHSLEFEDTKNMVTYITNWIHGEENLS